MASEGPSEPVRHYASTLVLDFFLLHASTRLLVRNTMPRVLFQVLKFKFKINASNNTFSVSERNQFSSQSKTYLFSFIETN